MPPSTDAEMKPERLSDFSLVTQPVRPTLASNSRPQSQPLVRATETEDTVREFQLQGLIGLHGPPTLGGRVCRTCRLVCLPQGLSPDREPTSMEACVLSGRPVPGGTRAH